MKISIRVFEINHYFKIKNMEFLVAEKIIQIFRRIVYDNDFSQSVSMCNFI